MAQNPSNEATYYFYEPIDDQTPIDFTAWLNNLSTAIDTINIRINSPGGSVFGARAVEQALREAPLTVNTYVDGLAASAASYIAIMGDTVWMAPGAFMMIHQAHSSAFGNAQDMIKHAALLAKIDASLAETYSAKSGLPVQDIHKMLEEETWLSASDAIAIKFADIINENPAPKPVNATNWNISNFSELSKAPEAVKELLNKQDEPVADVTPVPAPWNQSNKPDVAYLLRRIEVAERSF